MKVNLKCNLKEKVIIKRFIFVICLDKEKRKTFYLSTFMFWVYACGSANVVFAIHMHDICMHLCKLYAVVIKCMSSKLKLITGTTSNNTNYTKYVTYITISVFICYIRYTCYVCDECYICYISYKMQEIIIKTIMKTNLYCFFRILSLNVNNRNYQ